jgi:hypothetical protein
MKQRLRRLEAKHAPSRVYPVIALFTTDGRLERIHMSDGSQRTDNDAVLAFRDGLSKVPPKAYIGFDPDSMTRPQALESVP